jgi:formate dehydrogenase iron-sulfur subunit
MSLAKALQLEPEEIVRCVVDSGLRGRGGAAFPTGKKWAAALRNSSAVKFVVANADEGDPGAYIDRFILEDDPFLLLEGMAIAGYAIGAHKGYVYVRAEYPRAFDILQDAIVTARQSEVLGPHILGTNFAFDVDVIQGHGGYVCGEETALLNAIEGKRPEVRIRPPYPSSSGLFGKPTLVNNVETLANIPWILAHGGEAYRRLGFSNSPGTKVVSLNSLFAKPGLYEIEFGVPVRYIVEELGGGLKSGVLKGLMIGGPLAGILPPTLLDCKFGFEELASVGACVGHGGIVAFDENTSILELIHHVFSFAAYESCGRCFPCRLGTARIESQLDKLIRLGILDGGFESEWDDITNALESATACGFGSGVADFANSVRMHYREELGRCFT